MSQHELPIARPKQFHGLKCLSQFFDAIVSGTKTSEVRRDDRGYQVGDVMILNRINGEFPEILDPQCTPVVCEITHVLRGEEWGIVKGFVVLSFKKLTPTGPLPQP